MKNNYCNNQQDEECLNNLINEINDELTIACQIPFTVPKKQIMRIVDRAKQYFYKIYEDSVEEMYIGLPKGAIMNSSFSNGLINNGDKLTDANLLNTRGIIPMPDRVWSVNNVFEVNRFSGESGGFGSNGFAGLDSDFALDKFIYSDVYGAGIGSENLMYYVVNELFIDNARQVLQPQISYSYNRLSKKFRFQGELPKNAVIFQVYVTIGDCDLFNDEVFIRYCIAQAKVSLSRILGTFQYNLPGNITINFDLIRSEGQDELTAIIEEIKGDEGVDYFYTG